MRVEIRSLSKAYGDLEALRSFSATLESGSVTVLLGPSGCGKTSVLRILSGLIQADGGSFTALPPASLSYAFQEPRLLPWASALSNVELVLDGILDRKAARERARFWLGAVGLADFERVRPSGLSGGMRQRLALARAFARPSSLLLMDEPFQSQDLGGRVALMDLVQELLEREPRTVLMVTHDIQEALYLGDRILVMGKRPSSVVAEFGIDLPRAKRDFADPSLQSVEAELYRLLLPPKIVDGE